MCAWADTLFTAVRWCEPWTTVIFYSSHSVISTDSGFLRKYERYWSARITELAPNVNAVSACVMIDQQVKWKESTQTAIDWHGKIIIYRLNVPMTAMWMIFDGLTRTFVSLWECGIHFHSYSQIQRNLPILASDPHQSSNGGQRPNTEGFTFGSLK